MKLFPLLYILCAVIHVNTKIQTVTRSNFLPVVMWHGMGDSCCNPFSMGRIIKLIENRLPGIYVHSIQIGSNMLMDTLHGYIGSVNEAVDEACDKLTKDPSLQDGFNAIGFSQGAQFLRALVQRCPTVSVNNLVSVGGQHQGVFGVPKCSSDPDSSTVCEYIRQILNVAAYDTVLQEYFVQAQYWHDPLHEETYRNYSVFLADINNEKALNDDYKKRILSLSNFVLVKFLRDTMVVPKESSWFGFYAGGQDKELVPLNQTHLYLEDRIGLRLLDGSGKLHFLEVDGDHLQFEKEWFFENIVDPYFGSDLW